VCLAVEESNTEAEWLDKKRKRIGSSDARAILGCGYEGESELTVYDRMVHGVRKSFTSAQIEMMNEGRVMESAILDMFAMKNPDWIVEKASGFRLIVNPDFPDLCCTLDAQATHRVTGEKIVVEAKFEQNGSFEDYEDEGLPLKHLVQIQHQQICTGWKGGFLVSLLRGKYVQRWVERNDGLIVQMLLAYESLLKAVREKRPPNVGGVIQYQRAQGASNREIAQYVGKEASDLFLEALRLQEQASKIQSRLSRLKGILAEAAKGCLFVVLEDQQVVRLGKSGLELKKSLPRGVRVQV
jgi:predicted phage-related endonuclease